MADPSYSTAASGISTALQTYSKRRQPYARAADEIELAIHTLHAQQGQHGRQQQQQREARHEADLEADHCQQEEL